MSKEERSTEHQHWRELLTSVLRRSGAAEGLDPELALSRLTLDGTLLKPLYTADDLAQLRRPEPAMGSPRLLGGAPEHHWADVRARHLDDDPQRTNRAVLADLAGGVRSIWLEVGSGGLDLATLETALAGVDLAQTPVTLSGAPSALAAAQALLRLAETRGVDPAQLAGGAGADPIGMQARSSVEADLTSLSSLTALLAGTPLIPITVDGCVFADAGASDADELACVAASGLAYVRVLADAGIDDPFASMEFRYTVSADQFVSIAKLRAGRLLWRRIGELCAVVSPQRQHAVTSMAMMTRWDPWLNMVRTTVACFAALAGGAQAITVLPFDVALGRTDDFARRLARNTAAIALAESGLGRVWDPAAGSYYVETLTEQLAEAAWDRFTAIERCGGALQALNSGLTPTLLADSRQRRESSLATRSQPLVGVSMFADVAEKAVVREAGPTPARSAGQLPVLRYAEPFERLRDRVQAHQRTTGAAPQIVLATVGSTVAYGARVGFVQDLLAAAGLKTALASTDSVEGTESLVCLCGRDADYREHADAAVHALRSAGVKTIYLAGKPDIDVPVDGYLYAGCDAVQALTSILSAIGVR